MRKKDIDKIVRQLLEDNTRTYTQTELRQILDNDITSEHLVRIYRRYMYLKNKDILPRI